MRGGLIRRVPGGERDEHRAGPKRFKTDSEGGSLIAGKPDDKRDWKSFMKSVRRFVTPHPRRKKACPGVTFRGRGYRRGGGG